MSLETMIARIVLKSPLGRVYYHQIDDDETRRNFIGYKKYGRNSDSKNLIVDKSGKIVFGGFHYAIQVIKVGDTNYLKTNEKDSAGYQFFKEDGSAAFGGPHWEIRRFYNINDNMYLLAKHKMGGLYGFYREDGSVLESYGGQHFFIQQFLTFNDIKYLYAQHTKESDKCYYDEKGTPYIDLLDIGMHQVKDQLSGINKWDQFYSICNKIIRSSTGTESKKYEFLGEVLAAINEKFVAYKAQPEVLDRAINQFVHGLEYFFAHPDEAVGFMGGGQRQ